MNSLYALSFQSLIRILPYVLYLIIGYFAGSAISILVLIILLGYYYKGEQYNLLIHIFLLTFFLADIVNYRFDFIDSARYLVLAVGLLLTIRSTRLSTNDSWHLLPFVSIALYFSFFNSPISFDATIRALAYLILSLVIFGFIKQLYREYPIDFCLSLLILLALFFVVPLILNFTPLGTNFYVAGRFTGFMGNPNGLGLLAILLIPLADFLYSILKVGNVNFKLKYLYWIKGAIIFSVILTGSRNALFSIILYECFKIGFKSVASAAFTTFLLPASYFVLFAIDWTSLIYSLGLEEFFRIETLESGSGRTDVWEVVWAEIKKAPFKGGGILYDLYFVEQHRKQMIGVIPRAWYGVWNSYLSLWLNVGLVGLLAYFYFIFRMYMQSSIKRLALPFLIATLFSGIAESWMAASLNAFTPLFFLYFALQSVPLDEIELKTSTSEGSRSV